MGQLDRVTCTLAPVERSVLVGVIVRTIWLSIAAQVGPIHFFSVSEGDGRWPRIPAHRDPLSYDVPLSGGRFELEGVSEGSAVLADRVRSRDRLLNIAAVGRRYATGPRGGLSAERERKESVEPGIFAHSVPRRLAAFKTSSMPYWPRRSDCRPRARSCDHPLHRGEKCARGGCRHRRRSAGANSGCTPSMS